MINRWIKNKLRLLGFFKDDPIVGERTLISADSIIGKYTYIGRHCVITKSKIGRYCSIADNVTIGPGEHDIYKISTSSVFYEDPYSELTTQSCEIGNDVWIGVNSVIRRGVKIGNGVVIGANSFVNTDIPDFAVVVGNPAKVIKFRFELEKRNLISQSDWWTLVPEKAGEKFKKIEKS